MILPSKIDSLLTKNLEIISLPHPKKGLAKYMITPTNELLEIQSVLEEPSSYFIDESVQGGLKSFI